MTWFGGKREGAPVEKAKDNLEISLRKNFQKAVFGHFFRTCTYQSKDALAGQEEWLEAVDVPGHGWQIIRKIRVHLPDGPQIKQDPHTNHQNLDFFTAAEILARYEATQPILRPDAVAAEAKSLGAQHVRVFAEREGLAFDTGGIPHPTSDGRIVTAGMFGEEVYAKAQDAYQGLREKQLMPLTSLLSTADITLFQQRRDALEHVEDTLFHVMNLEVTVGARYIINAKFFPMMLKANKPGVKPEFERQFESNTIMLGKSAALLTGKPDIDNLIFIPLELARYFSIMSVAADVKGQMNKGPITHEFSMYCTQENVNLLLGHAVQILHNIGLKLGEEVFVYRYHKSCVSSYERNSKDQALSELQKVRSYLEDIKSYLEQQLGIQDADRTAVQKPDQDKLLKNFNKSFKLQ